MLWAAGVAVLAVVAVVAFGGVGSHRAAGRADPARFDLPALNGAGRVRLADFRGTPVVVNMFASWCSNCRQELPGFARAAAGLGTRVRFIGINSEETGDGGSMAREFHLAGSGFVLAHDVGRGGSALHDAYRARGMPVTAFYGPDGKLLETFNAQIPEATLRTTLHRLYGV